MIRYFETFVRESLLCGRKRARQKKGLASRTESDTKKEIIIIDSSDSGRNMENCNVVLNNNICNNNNFNQSLTQFDSCIEFTQEVDNEDFKLFAKLYQFCLIREDLINYPFVNLENYKKYSSMLKFNSGNSNYDNAIVNNSVYEYNDIQMVHPFLSLRSVQELAFGGFYLSDEVINSYIYLILQRQSNLTSFFKKSRYPQVFILKTYFYELIKTNLKAKLDKFDLAKNYNKFISSFKKKDINLKECTKILIPVLMNMKNSKHWCLVSVNIRKSKIIFYDSLCNYLNLSLEEEAIKARQDIVKDICSFFDFYLKDQLKAHNPNNSDNHDDSNKLNKKTNFFSSLFNKSKIFLLDQKGRAGGLISKLSTKSTSVGNYSIADEEKDKEKEYYDYKVDYNSEDCFNSEDSDQESEENILNFNKENKISFSQHEWRTKLATSPQQDNLHDGGIFLCKFLEYISRNEPISFTQEDIEYFRVEMTVELLNETLSPH